jgi:hypothetical protein
LPRFGVPPPRFSSQFLLCSYLIRKFPTKNSHTQDLVTCWFLCDFVGFDPWMWCFPSGSTFFCVALAFFLPDSPNFFFLFPNFVPQSTSDVRRITDVRHKGRRTSETQRTSEILLTSIVPHTHLHPTSEARPTTVRPEGKGTVRYNLPHYHPPLAIYLVNPFPFGDHPFRPIEPSLPSIAGSRYLCTVVITKLKLRASHSQSNCASSFVIKSKTKNETDKRRAKDIQAYKQKRAQLVNHHTKRTCNIDIHLNRLVHLCESSRRAIELVTLRVLVQREH